MAEGPAPVKEPRNQRGIVIRALREAQEMRMGVDLQKRVWGYSDVDTVPDQIFIVARESGGQVLGAFREEEPIGFALAFAGSHHGTVHLHSHMVGVAPEYQDRGVGRMLKLAQREDAIARGINLIEWTFDPLQLKNAHFNLVRLVAIVRRYIPNFYGRTSSPLHAGLPTDRLVAEWWIQSVRVRNLLGGAPPVSKPNRLAISIPTAIRQICRSDPAQAEEIQSRVREQFEQRIAARCAAVGFELDEQQASYVLEPYED
jgi:predicted GNAT superfamily acetyltransferase